MARVILYKDMAEERWDYEDDASALDFARFLARKHESLVIDNGGGILSVDATTRKEETMDMKKKKNQPTITHGRHAAWECMRDMLSGYATQFNELADRLNKDLDVREPSELVKIARELDNVVRYSIRSWMIGHEIEIKASIAKIVDAMMTRARSPQMKRMAELAKRLLDTDDLDAATLMIEAELPEILANERPDEDVLTALRNALTRGGMR
jgi:hypothetical protein